MGLRPLLLNTSASQGGAARAAYRLHQGLKGIGVDSHMLVRNRASREVDIHSPCTLPGKVASKIIAPFLDDVIKKFYRRRKPSIFCTSIFPDGLLPQIERLNPDLVHLHWVQSGFMRIETLNRMRWPVIWTLHDMWPFTGGCHYDDGCGGYMESCGRCPHLDSTHKHDLSRYIWRRKRSAWRNTDFVVVTPTRWLADCARKSTLFKGRRIETIPNGMNLNTFKPIQKEIARNILSLPNNKNLILFGAVGSTSDPRKGFKYIQKALLELSRNGWGQKAEVVVFGDSRPKSPPDFGMKLSYCGHINDETTMALYYSAADVMIVPSRQESFGQTVSEPMACGTPVVAFATSGLLDIVDHKINGYLAKPFDVLDLAQGIIWVLREKDRLESLSRKAADKARRAFGSELQASRYKKLYLELLGKN